jgi:competence protein ComEA
VPARQQLELTTAHVGSPGIPLARRLCRLRVTANEEPDLLSDRRPRRPAAGRPGCIPHTGRRQQGDAPMTRTSVLALVALLAALAAPAAAAQQAATPQPAPAAKAEAVVNLNTATAVELESLPGIGKSTAQRILEYRQKSGGFKKIEELMNVKGIGEKSFLKIKNRLTVAAPKS